MGIDARPRLRRGREVRDVIACLVARGWRRVALDRRDAALSWRNLAKTDFGRLAPGAIVNHFSGSQAVSHKATLAAALADRGADFYPACYDLRLPARAAVPRALGVGAAARSVVPAGAARDAGLLAAAVAAAAGGADGADAAATDAVAAARAARWRVVAQKYVERPLLFHGRKFDVRQWVLVTSLAPLVVWGFSDCYARFASAPWDLAGPGLGDRFAHLCNHSVQRDAPAGGPVPEHMWAARDLAAAVDGRFGAGACWLLEANVSPDVSRSTAVTAALVPRRRRTARLVLDEGHGDDAGAAVDPARAAGARAAPAWLWAREAPPPRDAPAAPRLADGDADA
ncbi:hypothetical protein JL720_14995 [Aureococcus anophagefferens]|nr:hypothetical protein JL720_14995 [Aureococcus anophagefferens]